MEESSRCCLLQLNQQPCLSQLSKLEAWHSGQHVFTESLSGALETGTITCDGPASPEVDSSQPSKHVGFMDFQFTGAQHFPLAGLCNPAEPPLCWTLHCIEPVNIYSTDT